MAAPDASQSKRPGVECRQRKRDAKDRRKKARMEGRKEKRQKEMTVVIRAYLTENHRLPRWR